MSDRFDFYVASSWRNSQQPAVVAALREGGFTAYDFRNPRKGDRGFHWSDIDPAWESWSPERYREALAHPVAVQGFGTDMAAMLRSNACVLVLPCGRSAHLEAGWFAGAGRPLHILLADGEPELMYAMANVYVDLAEMLRALEHRRRASA